MLCCVLVCSISEILVNRIFSVYLHEKPLWNKADLKEWLIFCMCRAEWLLELFTLICHLKVLLFFQ